MTEEYMIGVFVVAVILGIMVALIAQKVRRKPVGFEQLTNFIGDIGSSEKLGRDDRYRLYRRVLVDTPEGRKVLNDILSNCHLYHTSHGPHDERQTAFLEGERNVALRILHTINKEPADMPTSTKEVK